MEESEKLRSHHHSESSAGGSSSLDCWSEDATSTLIEAWGDRRALLNRRPFRSEDWSQVVSVVNARRNGSVRTKTETQCRERLKALKKRHQVESTMPSPSKWPFYYRLDSIIGAPAAEMITPSQTNPNPNRIISVNLEKLRSGGKRRMEAEGSDSSRCGRLASAVSSFGELYEKIERSKLEEMMAMEKQKRKFAMDFVAREMSLFMDILKMKCSNHGHPTTGEQL